MALYHYSSDTLSPGINEDFHSRFVPVRIHAKILPATITSKRFVYVRDQQKIATFIEEDLRNAGLLSGMGTPVAFTPQFGNNPARVSIVGFLHISSIDNRNVPPTTDVTIISSGCTKGVGTSKMTGNMGGSTSWGQNVVKSIDNQVAWLISHLKSASALLQDITFIEYNGVKYGYGHRTFPK